MRQSTPNRFLPKRNLFRIKLDSRLLPSLRCRTHLHSPLRDGSKGQSKFYHAKKRDTFSLVHFQEDITPVEKIFASDHPNGFYRTLVKFGEPYLPGNWEYSENLTSASSGKHCFPYWAASLSEEGTIIHAQCLGIRPTWMNDNRYT